MAADIGVKLKLDGERDFRNAVKDCNAELKNMESALKLATTQADGQAKSLDTLQKKEKALNDTIEVSVKKEKTLQDIVDKVKKTRDDAKKTLEDARKAEGDNAEAVEKAEKAYRNAEGAVNRWETELNKAKTTTAKLQNELTETKSEIDKFEHETEDAAEAEEEFSKEGKKATDAVDAMATAMISSGVVGALKDVAENLLDCVKAADEFEVAMKKVSTIADTSAVSAEDLEAAIMEQSSAMAVSASDYAEATYQAISASIDTADAVDFVANATKLAEAGFTDATSATDVLTTAINAYGMSAEDAGKIADILVTTQNLGKTSVDQLAQSLGNVLPIASTYNVSLEDLATSYVELTRNGINTASATTDLRAMLGELGDSSKTVAKIIMEKTGMSFSQLMDSGASLGDVMDILAKSVDNDKDKFAELWASARTSGVAALSLLNRGTKDYNGVLKQMKTSTGAVDTAFKKMTSTSEYTSKRLKNSVNNLKIAVGKELSPALTKLQGTFADLVEGATQWVKDNPQVVKAFTAIGIAVGVLVGAIVAYTAATKIAAIVQEMFNAAANSNPYILLASAIAACAAALAFWVASMPEEETASKHMKDAIDDLTAAHQNMVDQLAESEGNYKSTAGEIEATARQATTLKDRLFDLINAEDQTAENQAEIAAIVERLNTLYPELNLEYDKQTNSLNATNEELEKYIENTRKAAKAEALKELVQEQSKIIIQAESDIANATDEYKKNTEEYHDLLDRRIDISNRVSKSLEREKRAQQKVNELQAKGTASAEELQAAQDELTAATDDYNKQRSYQSAFERTHEIELAKCDALTDSYNETLTEHTETMADANAKIDTYIGEQQELEASVDESALAFDRHTEAMEINTGAMQVNAESIWQSKNAVERVSAAYVGASETIQGLANAVLESSNQISDSIRNAVDLSMGAFEELDTSSATYIEDMITNMQTRLTDLATWEQNLAKLIKYGVAEDIVQGWAAMGTASADMVGATVRELDTLQQTAPEQVAGLVGELNSTYAQLWQAAEGENAEAMGLKTAIAEQAAGGEEALKQLGVDLKSAAYDSMGYINDGFLDGIADGQQALNDAGEDVGSDLVDSIDEGAGVSSPSWKTEESGRYVDSGFVKGLTAGKASLLSVARGVANATIEAMRINPMTAQGIGLSFSTGLANGILSGRSAVIRAAVETAQAAITATKSTLDIHSPSKVMEGLGVDTGEGFAQGLAETTALISAEMGGMLGIPEISLPDLSKYDTYAAPTVNVYVGNRQLTAVMADAVTHEISAAQQAGYRGARTA